MYQFLNDKGFSLIEPLLVVVMMGVIILVMANLPNAFNLISKSKNLSLAREIASKQIEDKRNVSFSNLVNGTTIIQDPRINSLPQGNGSVTVEDCSAQICTNSEHVKQVSVKVTWQNNSKLQTVSLKTFIGEGGLNQ